MAFIFNSGSGTGRPADPPTLGTATPTWRAGDVIPWDDARPFASSPLGRSRTKTRS
jgi:hypothetical protein